MGELSDVIEDEEAGEALSDQVVAEVVAHKGYHSNAVLTAREQVGIRTYISEPKRGRRSWQGKAAEKAAVYGNRRRIRGERGKQLMRRRGELMERSFAHCYETGGMRRTHLRGHRNILKRLLVHVAGFNLGLVMRKVFGIGKPRVLQGLRAALLRLVCAFCAAICTCLRRSRALWSAIHSACAMSFRICVYAAKGSADGLSPRAARLSVTPLSFSSS
ncbi:MAG TPA: transposase [Thermoanaerobaculia bacterium]|nr:transposase [Thermoanaerobaculia bacterium]